MLKSAMNSYDNNEHSVPDETGESAWSHGVRPRSWAARQPQAAKVSVVAVPQH